LDSFGFDLGYLVGKTYQIIFQGERRGYIRKVTVCLASLNIDEAVLGFNFSHVCILLTVDAHWIFLAFISHERPDVFFEE